MTTTFPPAPEPDALAALLDRHAPLSPAPLSPEIEVFQAEGLVEIWEAAEQLAGRSIPSPFWAFPWPAGTALARVLLDHPEWVHGRRVLDVGCGGGVAALAAARAGAAEVVANDLDPWALAAAGLAARRNGLQLTPLIADLTREPERAVGFEVVLCGDLAYERSAAPAQRALLEHARATGARVLVADAGRSYFEAEGRTPLASWTLPVPRDLEGVGERTARVYAW